MGELSINKIESRIFTIRGLQVMLDRNLAESGSKEKSKQVSRKVSFSAQ